MPISATDGCGEQHWLEVRALLCEAVSAAGFQPSMVSDAEDVGIIQKRIIQNLYNNPIVVCDVSGKNPNVMFELGLRLAFDKPTIIVKDDKTTYSFDTAPIEHLGYPRDLRYGAIMLFKSELAKKIRGTYEASQNDTGYTTFLKQFGTFTVAKLDEKQISKDEALFEELRELKTLVRMQRRLVVPAKALDDVLTASVIGTPQPASLFTNEAELAARAKKVINRYITANHITKTELPNRRAEILALVEEELAAYVDPGFFDWERFCMQVFRQNGWRDLIPGPMPAGKSAG